MVDEEPEVTHLPPLYSFFAPTGAIVELKKNIVGYKASTVLTNDFSGNTEKYSTAPGLLKRVPGIILLQVDQFF